MKMLIDQFEAGGQQLKQILTGLSPEKLQSFPIPGTWSLHQLVVHMQDSDAVAIDRMKRVIAEDLPLLVGFNEDLFVKRLFYDDQSAADAAELFDLNRRQFARVLRKLPESAWTRAGIHTERGKLTLTEILQIYVSHLDHHLKFATEKRAKLGI